jgi:D-psicose/D-tagatose/L-ribulose 3-epimerase
VATGVVLSADADLSSENPEIAARGEDVIARSLETARELGRSSVSGLTYAGLGRYTAPPTQGQRDRVIEALGRLDKKARSLGVRLGIEPINRCETYMVNTIAEAAAIVTAVGSDNLFVHLDRTPAARRRSRTSAVQRRTPPSAPKNWPRSTA